MDVQNYREVFDIRYPDRLYIGGEWVAPAGSAMLEVICPSNERRVGRVPEASTTDIDRAVAAARHAFDHGPWPRMTPAERGARRSEARMASRRPLRVHMAPSEKWLSPSSLCQSAST